MDIQHQVAVRRAELVKQEVEHRRAQAAVEEQAEQKRRLAEAALAVEQERQESEALQSFADEHGLGLKDSDLTMPEQSPVPLDVTGFKQTKISALLRREARKRWSPRESWMIIGCIVAGVCLVPVSGLGFVPLLFGLWSRWDTNQRYRAEVKAEYPDIFS